MYRAYILKSDGHFKGVVELECASDELALEAARQAGGVYGVEVWQGARRLAVLTPSRPQQGPSAAA
jgi:uncharacterized protein YuzE